MKRTLFKFFLIAAAVFQIGLPRSYPNYFPGNVNFPAKPYFVSAESEAGSGSSGKKMKWWKPVIITTAAGGITYALYSIRSR